MRTSLGTMPAAILIPALLMGAAATATEVGSSPDASGLGTFRSIVSRAVSSEPGGGYFDEVWSSIFASSPGPYQYRSPAAVIAYHRGDVLRTDCASPRPGAYDRAAVYCRTDESIAYDEDYLFELYESEGPYAPIAVLAHEWGHHIQAILELDQKSVRQELQADCFAGMYQTWAELSGNDQQSMDDAMVAAEGFYRAGDGSYRDDRVFDRYVHGSPNQRLLAFATGYMALTVGMLASDTGLPWCIGYSEWAPDDRSEVGPYGFLNVPGRHERPSKDKLILVISGEPPSGYVISEITLQWHPGIGAPLTNETIDAWISDVALGRFGTGTLRVEDLLIDLASNVDGLGLARYFTGSASLGRHGLVAAVAPPGLEGLLSIIIDRSGAPPSGDAPGQVSDQEWVEVAEQLGALYQVLTRLCSPVSAPTILGCSEFS